MINIPELDTAPRPIIRIMQRTKPGGPRVCAVCRVPTGLHDPQCPIVQLVDQLKELVAHVGTFIVDARVTLNEVEQLLTDGEDRP